MIKNTGILRKNVLGGELQPCCFAPMTGYFRDGYCRNANSDGGRHVVCAQVTKAFLEFTKEQGNNLSNPAPAYGFPGLKPGDRWCLCAQRWKEALNHDVAPPVILEACDEATLQFVSLQTLKEHAL